MGEPADRALDLDAPGEAPGRRHSSRLVAATSALTAFLAMVPSASAQEIKLSGPLARDAESFHAMLAHDVAARTDVYGWLSLGGTPAPDKAAGPFGAIGLAVTNAGFVTTGVFKTPSELRWGPWGQLFMDGVGGRAEGGLAVQLYFFGRRAHAPVDIQFGAGYGEDALGKKPHLALTIAGGRRTIEAVAWPPPTDRHGNEMELPQLVAGFRLFLSIRRTIEDDAEYWATGGIELELGTTIRASRPTSETPLF